MNALRLLIRDQRGVALPLAMVTLVILSSLIVGFIAMSSTEPTIANNHILVAQARSLAETGIERAIWALNNPTDTKGLPNSMPLPATWTAVAPYNGSQLVAVSSGGTGVGGFRVTVTKGASAAELKISSVGWVPTDTGSGRKAHQKVEVTVFNPQFLFKDPAAALSVRGELQAGGNSTIDSRSDTSCGAKSGTITTGATSMNGNASDIWGADGNNTRNQSYDAGNGAMPGVATGHPAESEHQRLRRVHLERRRHQRAPRLRQGARHVSAGHGLVQRQQPDPERRRLRGHGERQQHLAGGRDAATATSDFASVDIHGNAPVDPSGIFKGILFVNGALSISGNVQMYGMIYAQNDISYHGTGTGGVWGPC